MLWNLNSTITSQFPLELKLYILNFIGYNYKIRNGKLVLQLNKEIPIFSLLNEIPKAIDSQVFIHTDKWLWLRRSWFKKIIKLETIPFCECEDSDIVNYQRFYSISWYEKDFDDSFHESNIDEEQVINLNY